MRLLVSLLSLVFFTGLTNINPVHDTFSGEKIEFVSTPVKLKTGDIVLRSGRGWISDFFRNTSHSKKEYSHAGIIIAGEHDTLVAHMIGGEISSGFRKETLASFCSVKKNKAYAIYRYDFLSGHEKQLEEYLDNSKRLNLIFDERFDLETDSALYCTELIYKMIQSAGFKLNHSTYNGVPFIGIDDLYVRNQANLLFENKY